MAADRRELTNEEREAILREALMHSNGHFMKRMPNGFGQMLAAKYSCHVSCVRRILQHARVQGMGSGNMIVSVASKKKGRCGRPPSHAPTEVKAKLQELPLSQRTNLRAVSFHSGISYGSLHRYLKKGVFRSHSSALRPLLTDANKLNRVKFALSFIKPGGEVCEMNNHVHLDEKWFYLTKERRTYYLIPGEEGPDRKCKSKRFITKVMFLTAVARPRYVDDLGTWWDGKVGTWPFVQTANALRSSVNRPAGTPETKVVTVTKDVYRSYLVEKVMPAVVSSWPGPPTQILLQHDNAKAHVTSSDAALQVKIHEYKQQGWTFELAPQPPNSPDMNVLDLGFFASLQSLQHRESAKSIDQLIANVNRAFVDYPCERLDRTFVTLQSCMIETLKVGGNNAYKIPHMSKVKQATKGRLTRNVVCPEDVRAAAVASLGTEEATRLERVFKQELADLKTMNELAQSLESIALDDDDIEDIVRVLDELGIEPIDISEDR
ncbi:Aste57867_23454 [Aphanomyces stellatus]|uniref:Aste57867_23454 protein n=1 Tax=Aphanomyces stellatus TaxID=120398 RepID=A0A485LSB2_9STRA|nr:hypothetical protein As57867_023383 [Aphanomyces stellatus]VFU00100.1 Aste57867_23454 [Aphanomyces stellatus]